MQRGMDFSMTFKSYPLCGRQQNCMCIASVREYLRSCPDGIMKICTFQASASYQWKKNLTEERK